MTPQEVIDYFCQKIGTTYDSFLPEAMRYFSSDIIARIIVYFLAILLGCFLFIMAKRLDDKGKGEGAFICLLIGIVFLCIGSAGFCNAISGLFKYLASPTVYVLQQLLKSIQ